MSYEEPDYDDFEYDFCIELGEIMTELRKHKEECAPVIRLMRKITKLHDKTFDDDKRLSNLIADVADGMQSLNLKDKYDNIYDRLNMAHCTMARDDDFCPDCGAYKVCCKLFKQ